MSRAPLDDQANRLVRRYTFLTLTTGLIPIPAVDMLMLGGLQLKMLHELAETHQVTFSREVARALAGSLLGSALPTLGAASLASSAAKLLPGVGTVTGMASMALLSSATTYALGQVFARHFSEGGTLEDFDPETAREDFHAALDEGRAVAAAMRDGGEPPPPPEEAPPPRHDFGRVLRRTLLTFLLLFFTLGIVAGGYYLLNTTILAQDPLQIALIGPQTGDSKSNGRDMARAARLAIHEFNRNGGIQGRPIALQVFDDQNKPQRAMESAVKIAGSEDTLGVIGHYGSSTSLAASPIYQRYGVPVITGSATSDKLTRGNDWYFRVIFNDTDQSILLANYIHRILGHENVSIVYVDNDYGKELLGGFLYAAQIVGVRVNHTWTYSPDGDDFGAMLDQMLNELVGQEDPGALFIATHAREAVDIVTSLKKRVDMPIIGADSLASSAFQERLRTFPQERTRPGYYTDGIYATFPYLPQLSGTAASRFERVYQSVYEEAPSPAAAMYYDATLVLLTAMERADLRLDAPVKIQRRQIREALWNMAGINHAVEGVTGTLYFDKHGDAVKNVPIGLFQDGQPVVASEQYQLINDIGKLENILEEAIQGQLIHANGKYLRRAQVVYTGVDFIDIDDLNIANATFTANFYLWFRHNADYVEEDVDFVNLYQPIKMLEDPLVERSVESVAGPMKLKTYRVKGRFKADLDFQLFPLDKQLLPIRFRHNILPRQNLIYVVDTLGLKPRIQDTLAVDRVLNLEGWHVNARKYFQDIKYTDSTLGVPKLIHDPQRIEFSQFNAVLEIQRDNQQAWLKYLVPMGMLLFLCYMVLLLPVAAIAARILIAVGVLLFTAPFHNTFISGLPFQNHLMLVEYGFFLMYFLAVLVIMISVVLYTLHYMAEVSLHGKTTTPSLVVFVLNWMLRLFIPIVLFWFLWDIWNVMAPQFGLNWMEP